ncbi:uncharacterized protein EI90DRAFT_3287847 [Cantharellus anzutake]|uniref:uncharacterized protein n=1 Tax=Cantharellus anzutake TaxID=1750568 RepID=UPI001907B151|nr:uncharacterized protein EI90DRAFT_3287847 [Cantharellus anzutake]KAF8335988.1 hypothetical protein EI90DRAFT_3287847 [Cantharellus anzutake]
MEFVWFGISDGFVIEREGREREPTNKESKTSGAGEEEREMILVLSRRVLAKSERSSCINRLEQIRRQRNGIDDDGGGGGGGGGEERERKEGVDGMDGRGKADLGTFRENVNKVTAWSDLAQLYILLLDAILGLFSILKIRRDLPGSWLGFESSSLGRSRASSMTKDRSQAIYISFFTLSKCNCNSTSSLLSTIDPKTGTKGAGATGHAGAA